MKKKSKNHIFLSVSHKERLTKELVNSKSSFSFSQNIIRLVFLIFIITLIINNKSFCQVTVQRLSINEQNTAFVYFSDIPNSFSSKLSDDKAKIIITVNNATVLEKAREVHAAGFISDIFVKNVPEACSIIVQTKSKTFYTVVPLPYSKSLMIETFDWNRLSKPDENYRYGLFAIEDGIYETAEKFLYSASESGNQNAAANLGIIQLYEGKLKTSFKNLLFAQKLKTNIPDAYAALSQIFKMFNFTEKANFFAAIFKTMTGLNSFPEIAIGEIPAEDSLDKETMEILLKLNMPNESQALNDSLNNRFNKVLKQPETNSLNAGKEIAKSFFPDWIYNYVFYILLILITLVIMLFVAYFKWRKKQINRIGEKTISLRSNDEKLSNPTNFEQEFDNAKDSINYNKSRAVNQYKQSEILADENNNLKNSKTELLIQNNIKLKAKPSIDDEEKSKKEQIQKSADTKMEDTDRFEEKLDKIAKQLIAAQQKQSLEEYENEIELKRQNKTEGMDAKAKLAMHLQEKNLFMKKEQLDKFDEDVPDDQKKINEMSKKFGIEKSSLETRKDISKIQNDRKALSELEKKFSDPEK